MTEYKKLEAEISKSHFILKQIKRTDFNKKLDVAIYEQISKEDKKDIHYEVIIVHKQESTQIKMGGATIDLEDKELYPGSERWGVDGFSFIKLENAEHKYNELIKHITTINDK